MQVLPELWGLQAMKSKIQNPGCFVQCRKNVLTLITVSYSKHSSQHTAQPTQRRPWIDGTNISHPSDYRSTGLELPRSVIGARKVSHFPIIFQSDFLNFLGTQGEWVCSTHDCAICKNAKAHQENMETLTKAYIALRFLKFQ